MTIDVGRHRDEYAERGFTVLRGAIPADLVERLRRAAEEVRSVTRAAQGPGATRPPGGYVGGRLTQDFTHQIDIAAFEEFEACPAIRQFVDATLGPDHQNDHDAFTILFEAEDREWVQSWHRDYRDNVPWIDHDAWAALVEDLAYFNQFNAALYHDISLWLVPGSHRRPDTAEEAAVVARTAATAPVWVDGVTTAAGYARAAADYLEAMPGGHRVVLAPGDVAMYRDSSLHLGHYLPTVRRATLHGHFDDERGRAYFDEVLKRPAGLRTPDSRAEQPVRPAAAD